MKSPWKWSLLCHLPHSLPAVTLDRGDSVWGDASWDRVRGSRDASIRESQCGVPPASLPTWLRPGNLLATFPLTRNREQHKSFSTFGRLQTQLWGFGGLFSSCREERTDLGITWATLGPPDVCSLAETAGGSRRWVSWGRIDRS